MKLEIDVNALTVGDIEALEDMRKLKDLIAWLVKHAGANADELRALPARELKDVQAQVQAAITAGLALPKANGGS